MLTYDLIVIGLQAGKTLAGKLASAGKLRLIERSKAWCTVELVSTSVVSQPKLCWLLLRKTCL